MTIETDDSRIQDLLHTKRQLEKALMAALERVNSLKRAISMLNEAIETSVSLTTLPQDKRTTPRQGGSKG